MGSKLSEQQLLALLELLSTTLTDNCTDRSNCCTSEAPDSLTVEDDGSRDVSHDSSPKRQRLSDEKLCVFVAECTSVLLCQCRVQIPSDVISKIHDVSFNSNVKFLKLVFVFLLVILTS